MEAGDAGRRREGGYDPGKPSQDVQGDIFLVKEDPPEGLRRVGKGKGAGCWPANAP